MKKPWALFFVFLLCFDLATKFVAYHLIPRLESGPYPFGGIGIFSLGEITFSLNYIVNTGAAFNLFAGYGNLLFALRIAIIAAMIFFMPKRFSLWLIITGAVGNAIDYCVYGYVIDFFHFTFWGYSFPIFNVADACITIGAFLLIFFSRKKVNEIQVP